MSLALRFVELAKAGASDAAAESERRPRCVSEADLWWLKASNTQVPRGQMLQKGAKEASVQRRSCPGEQQDGWDSVPSANSRPLQDSKAAVSEACRQEIWCGCDFRTSQI
ncbi:unnamed protein product [Effrenium voratum]|nr:unnamed protein product [Effrenium voratum]